MPETPSSEGMAVIMVGDPVNGLRIIGPFKTNAEALDWADRHIEDSDWWAADLEAQSEWERQ